MTSKTTNNSKKRHHEVSIDILLIFYASNSINWKELRENSIHRILYFSSIFYSFIFPKLSNPFISYKFIIGNRGPHSSDINEALIFLKADILDEDKEVYKLVRNDLNPLLEIEGVKEKYEWISIVVKILAIYGENKIYDFIFQDPEYQRVIKSNTSQGLNTSIANASLDTLNQFKKVFEDNVDSAKGSLPIVYLQLYFDYVFSKILRREI